MYGAQARHAATQLEKELGEERAKRAKLEATLETLKEVMRENNGKEVCNLE